MNIINAYLFDEAEETGRKHVQLRTKREGLEISASENILYMISWRDLDVTIGGSNGKQIFLKSTTQTELSLFTSDWQLLKQIEHNAGNHARKILEPTNKAQKLQILTSPVFLFSIFLFLMATLGFTIYWGAPKIVKKAAKATPVQTEKSLGELFIKSYQQEKKIIENKQILKAVDQIFMRLKPHIKEYKGDFTFYVVNDPQVNAFAVPGGFIVINSGLLLQAESAEELAGVLAHEISHITEHHAMERIINMLGISLAVQLLLGDVSGFAAVAIQGAQLVSRMQFSQSQETEADVLGFNLLKNSKIDYKGFINFFERQSQKKSDTVETIEKQLNFISSHPLDEKRMKTIQTLYDKEPYTAEPLDIHWEEIQTIIKNLEH